MPRGLRQARLSPFPLLGILGSLAALVAAGCAQIEAPKGGPEDRTPPAVESTHPESLAVGVPTGDSLVVQFSERMDNGTVEDWIFISPEAGRLRFKWDGPLLTVFPQEPLREETTYVLLLSSKMEDRRRNPLGRPILIPFSTGEELEAGQVRGSVKTGRLQAGGAFVFAWRGDPVLRDSLIYPPGGISDALRRGQTATDGSFLLANLPVSEPLTLCALFDGDENRSYDPKGDLWGCLPAPVVLSDTLPEISDVDIYVVYPDEPGTLSGRVIDSLCTRREPPALLRSTQDSLRALLAARPDSLAAPDSLRAIPFSDSLVTRDEPDPWKEWDTWVTDTTASALTSAERVHIDSLLKQLEIPLRRAVEESAYCARPVWLMVHAHVDSPEVATVRLQDEFSVSDLAPGEYWLRAFRDLDFDRRRAPAEPQSELLGPILLEPARNLEGLEILLPELPRPWPEDLLKPQEPESSGADAGEPGGEGDEP